MLGAPPPPGWGGGGGGGIVAMPTCRCVLHICMYLVFVERKLLHQSTGQYYMCTNLATNNSVCVCVCVGGGGGGGVKGSHRMA